MTVLRVDEARALALCGGEDGAKATVEIALVSPVAPGDRLLVHAGTAIARMEPETT
jgi:hydrogenase maturation factor